MEVENKLKASYGLESIDFQKDTKIVQDLYEQVCEAEELYRKGSKDYSSVNKKIESLIFNRFGLRVKIVERYDLLSQMGFSKLRNFTGFDPYNGEVKVTLLQKIFNSQEAIDRVKKGMEEFDAWLQKNEYKIDFKNAVITGLPNTFDSDIYINWKNIFNMSISSFTNMEIAAGILHEIGHVFTFCTYVYKHRDSTLAFEDIIRKSNGRPDSIIVGYNKIYNGNLDPKDYKNTQQVLVGIIEDNSKRNEWNMNSGLTATAPETAADQFVSRFGIGREMSSFLVKIGYFNETKILPKSLAIHLENLKYKSLSCRVNNIIDMSPEAIKFITGICFSLIMTGFLKAIGSFFKANSSNLYECDYRRVMKFLIDAIRVIRTDNTLTEKEKLGLLDTVDFVKYSLMEMEKSGFQKKNHDHNIIVRMFSSNLTNKAKLSIMEGELEELMENSLHAEALRIGSVSTEAIAPQHGDKFVSRLIDYLRRLREDYYKTPNDPVFLKAYEKELEKMIEKRFGYRMPVTLYLDPKKQAFMSRDYMLPIASALNDVYRLFSDLITKYKNNVPLTEEELKRMKFYWNRGNEVDKYLTDHNVIVNEKEARIEGLPSDKPWYSLHLGLPFLFSSDLELTDDEAASIIMHEIGHSFTITGTLYKTRQSKIVFEDALREYSANKNISQGEALVLSYNKAYNGKLNPKNIKYKIKTVAILDTVLDFKPVTYWDESHSSYTDSEFLADQFATRFGMANSLARALNKLFTLYPNQLHNRIAFTKGISLMACFYGVMNISVPIIMMFGFPIFGLIALFLMLVFYIPKVITGLVTSNNELRNKISTAKYDIDYKRNERVALDLIRQLRLYGGDSKDTIETVDLIYSFIDGNKDIYKLTTSYPIFSRLIEFFNKDIKNERELAVFGEDLEKMMENKLHIESRRLKNLLGEM